MILRGVPDCPHFSKWIYAHDCNICATAIFFHALRKESYNTKEELDIFLQDTLPQFHGPRMNDTLEKMKEDFVKIIQSEGNYL